MAMAEAKHERRKNRQLHHLEIHPPKGGKHLEVQHHHIHDGAPYMGEPHHDAHHEKHHFTEEEGHEAMMHIAKHAKIKDGWPGENEAEEKEESGSYEREDEEEGIKA